MMTVARCGECGAEIPVGAPDGHCTRCLFLLGLNPLAVMDETESPDLTPLLARPHSPLGVKFYRLGDYELVEEIARGAMGVVFRARQAGLNRAVALKFILAGRLASPALVKRFQVEAEAAAALHHPNIVSVIEIGEHEGHQFYSMELIDGAGLDRRLSEFRLPAPEALAGDNRSAARRKQQVIARLVADVARAVAFAHQRGVLHRDLKPSNILIDGEGKPHLTDFGLAKLMHEDRTQFTICGTMLGTPNYMAPELASGFAHEATTAADVYSLGAILYELLTGQPPFHAPTPVEVWRRATEEEAKNPCVVNRLVGPDLATVCLKCLEKEPQRRYPSALAVAEDLERWLAGEPITARPVSAGERAWRWCRRKPGLAGLAFALAAVAIAGFVGVSTQWRRAERGARETRLHLYAADMGLAHQALAEGNLGRARELLEAHRPGPGEEDTRGFEWRLFQHGAQGGHAAALLAHSNVVNSVAFSPDGQWLATASADRRVNLWDFNQRRLSRTLLAHTGSVSCVAFSPDSRLLATACEDGWVRLWNTATWQVFTQLAARPYLLEFSPTAPLLAYSEGGSLNIATGRVRLWNYATGARAGTWTNAGSRFAFTRDGKALLTGNSERLALWDITTGRLLRKSTSPFTTLSIAMSPDLAGFAACSFQGEVRFFDLADLDQSIALMGQTGRPRSVAFSPDGSQLASTSGDQTIRVWNTTTPYRTNAAPRTLRGHGRSVRCLAFSPDGRFLVSGDKDGAVLLWNVETSADVAALTNIFVSYTSAPPVFSSDSQFVATLNAAHEVGVWNVGTRQHVQLFSGAMIPLALSDEPRTLTTLSPNYTWQVWDVNSGSLRSEAAFVQPENAFTAKLSPDGRLLAVGYLYGSFTLWNTQTRTEQWQQDAHRFTVREFAFSSDGRWLATASQDHTAKLWDLDSQKELAALTGHSDLVFSIAFSPDGQTVATGSGDHTARLWQAPTGRLLGVLRGHREGVIRVAFSPDGKTLATAGDDDSVRLWHLATQREVARLNHAGSVLHVGFAPNGELLVSGSSRRVMQFFQAPGFAALNDASLQKAVGR